MKRWSGECLVFIRLSDIYQCPHRPTCDIDYAQDHAELGAVLNGFSLNESVPLSTAIERTGQAVDATYMSTTRLVSALIAVPAVY